MRGLQGQREEVRHLRSGFAGKKSAEMLSSLWCSHRRHRQPRGELTVGHLGPGTTCACSAGAPVLPGCFSSPLFSRKLSGGLGTLSHQLWSKVACSFCGLTERGRGHCPHSCLWAGAEPGFHPGGRTAESPGGRGQDVDVWGDDMGKHRGTQHTCTHMHVHMCAYTACSQRQGAAQEPLASSVGQVVGTEASSWSQGGWSRAVRRPEPSAGRWC